MKCFSCEVSKSCPDCLSRITRIAENSVEINKVKRQPENEFGYALLYYKTEAKVLIGEPVQKPIKNAVNTEQKKIQKIILKTELFVELVIMKK